MSKSSFEGLGEPYFDDWFRRVLIKENIKYLPPGTIRGLDYIISDEIIVLELEDTILEIYNAIRQILSIMPIIRNLELGVVIAIPAPSRIESMLVPLAKYFNELADYQRKEFWLLSQNMIIRILAETFMGFKLHFKTLSENIIRIKLYDGFFTKETAEELEQKIRSVV